MYDPSRGDANNTEWLFRLFTYRKFFLIFIQLCVSGQDLNIHSTSCSPSAIPEPFVYTDVRTYHVLTLVGLCWSQIKSESFRFEFVFQIQISCVAYLLLQYE